MKRTAQIAVVFAAFLGPVAHLPAQALVPVPLGAGQLGRPAGTGPRRAAPPVLAAELSAENDRERFGGYGELSSSGFSEVPACRRWSPPVRRNAISPAAGRAHPTRKHSPVRRQRHQ